MNIEQKIDKYLSEKTGDKAEYQAFFKKMLKKFGASDIGDLSGEEKKKFLAAVDAGWKADHEE